MREGEEDGREEMEGEEDGSKEKERENRQIECTEWN